MYRVTIVVNGQILTRVFNKLVSALRYNEHLEAKNIKATVVRLS